MVLATEFHKNPAPGGPAGQGPIDYYYNWGHEGPPPGG